MKRIVFVLLVLAAGAFVFLWEGGFFYVIDPDWMTEEELGRLNAELRGDSRLRPLREKQVRTWDEMPRFAKNEETPYVVWDEEPYLEGRLAVLNRNLHNPEVPRDSWYLSVQHQSLPSEIRAASRAEVGMVAWHGWLSETGPEVRLRLVDMHRRLIVADREFPSSEAAMEFLRSLPRSAPWVLSDHGEQAQAGYTPRDWEREPPGTYGRVLPVNRSDGSLSFLYMGLAKEKRPKNPQEVDLLLLLSWDTERAFEYSGQGGALRGGTGYRIRCHVRYVDVREKRIVDERTFLGTEPLPFVQDLLDHYGPSPAPLILESLE